MTRTRTATAPTSGLMEGRCEVELPVCDLCNGTYIAGLRLS